MAEQRQSDQTCDAVSVAHYCAAAVHAGTGVQEHTAGLLMS